MTLFTKSDYNISPPPPCPNCGMVELPRNVGRHCRSCTQGLSNLRYFQTVHCGHLSTDILWNDSRGWVGRGAATGAPGTSATRHVRGVDHNFWGPQWQRDRWVWLHFSRRQTLSMYGALTFRNRTLRWKWQHPSSIFWRAVFIRRPGDRLSDWGLLWLSALPPGKRRYISS